MLQKAKNGYNGKIRVYYPNTFRFKKGDRYYIFDVRRQFAGIFINRSKNVILSNIKQRFNYSLAFVAQDCENITVDSVEFAPENGSARKMASIADFIQLCMCRGKAIVRNSRYAGAVHQNVRIIGNTFQKYGGVCISAKATFLQTKKDKNSKLQARCNGIKHCLTEALHTE